MSSETRPEQPDTPVVQHRVRRRFLLVLGGLIGSVAITVPLHWTTALHVLAGMVLPLALGAVLARVSRYRLRFPGLVGLGVTLVGILVVCLVARYPNPAKAFEEVMRVPVPEGVRDLSAECGWFDGRITVLWFTADPGVIRKLVPPREEVSRLGEYALGKRAEDAWRTAFSLGAIIDPSLRQFPGWKEPWQAGWHVTSGVGEPMAVGIVWDDDSGKAIVWAHQD